MSNYSSRLPEFRKRYDLIVIGGGIYGAVMAWEAASRGLLVALLEKGDFCCATSANSLKVIHGGIRYLQNLDFARIKESVRERRALLRIAPHLVSPLECVMPTYRELSKSKFALWSGMKLYDFIAYDRNHGLDTAKHITRGKLLSRTELQSILPDLQDNNITGGACWCDAQVFNSERLVLAFLMSAKEKGAHICNYLEVKDFIVDNNKVRGVLAEDSLSSHPIKIVGDTIIDCTGPWMLLYSKFQDRLPAKSRPCLARAVNLVVNRSIASCAVGIKTRFKEDAGNANRLLFATPWRGGTIIGTWYFSDTGKPEDQQITDAELATCISQVNSAFPSLGLSKDDVARVHLGRLPAESASTGTGEPEPQKNFKIVPASHQGGPTGLYWVQGVKYTTARDVAKRALEIASQSLSKPLSPSRTHEVPLCGGDIPDMATFLASCRHRYIKHFSEKTINHLVNNYGTNVGDIVRYAEEDPTRAEHVPGTTDAIKAELSYVIDLEMVCTLSDLMLRRTDLGSFAMPQDETINYCADLMAKRWGWDQARKAANVQDLLDQYPAWVKQHAKPAALKPAL